ncbi:heavy metal-associated isoprenylated plant protein 8-like [Bidens hawaiensis]|uniref:heavy metal-associated isoprenylated plant protein 8-like n=1 Tax=Bidens hawaiensis TaxID=980011 RepID=UPI00404B3427
MGKNKNNNNNNSNNDNSNNTEEPKPEENSNKADGADDKSNNQKSDKNNKAGKIVLGVYLHCQGCVETLVKSLRGFEGVEEVEVNAKDHRVTVKGKSADPVRVAERVRRKTGKHVDIIFPVQKKQQPEKKQEKKPEASKVQEVALKMHIHCEGCSKHVKHCIHKMEGVQTVNVEMEKSLVTVKGTMDPKNLVAYISKRAGRHAEIVNPKNKNKDKKDGEQKDENQKNDQKNEKNKDNNKNAGSPYPNIPPGLIYAPQLFSDENPNACSIM